MGLQASAWAGHWGSALTGSGSIVAIRDGVRTTTPWSFVRLIVDGIGASCDPGHSVSLSTSGTLTQTFTWAPDNPSDTPCYWDLFPSSVR